MHFLPLSFLDQANSIPPPEQGSSRRQGGSPRGGMGVGRCDTKSPYSDQMKNLSHAMPRLGPDRAPPLAVPVPRSREPFRAKGPRPSRQPPFGAYEDEAAFCASIATFDELLAYFIECSKKLVCRRLGRRRRIRMIERIIKDLPREEVQKVVDRMMVTHPEQVA